MAGARIARLGYRVGILTALEAQDVELTLIRTQTSPWQARLDRVGLSRSSLRDGGWFAKLRHLAPSLLLSALLLMAVRAAAQGQHPSAPDHTFRETMRWWWQMKRVPWPAWIVDPPQTKPPATVGPGELRVTFINHATLLIQMEGLNLLTDPIWSMRAGPLSWLGARRVRAPGQRLEDLPPIHAVLLSHDHYDHLDLPTLRRLQMRDRPLVLCGRGVETRLPKGMRAEALDWWQCVALQGVKATFVPAQHHSGRGLMDGNRTQWGGFVLESPGGRVYFAGDTASGAFLEEIKARFAPFRLCLFPIGNYEKRWFMQNQHMNPADAVAAHRLLQAQQSLGYHVATFEEHPEQAIDAHVGDLARTLQEQGVAPDRFWILAFGEGRDVGYRFPPIPAARTAEKSARP